MEGEFLEPIAEFQGIKYKINLSLKIVMILGAGFISIAILVWFKTRVSITAGLIYIFITYIVILATNELTVESAECLPEESKGCKAFCRGRRCPHLFLTCGKGGNERQWDPKDQPGNSHRA